MPFFGNKRRDFSIQPPRQQVDGTPFFVTDSANIDFTLDNLNLTADLTFTGVVAGTYGDATHIPILQIDQWGRVTGVTTTTFSASGILLQTNSITNPTQTILNLIAGTNMTITDDGLGNITFDATGGGGSGTVISVSASTGMNFTTITTSGSVAIDTTKVPYIPAGFSTGLLKWDGSAWVFDNNTYLTTAVTSIGTAGLISGGTITSTGTITTSMNTNKLVGRGTPGVGVMEEITLGTGLSLSGTTLNVTSTSGSILHGTASGTDTYTVTITGVTSYADGDAYLIRFPNGNTTGATININGLGAINLYRNNDGPLIGGDIQANSEMLLVYNSTTTIFQCIGTSPNTIIAYVTNDDTVTITKGQAVYAFGGTGDRMTVKLANNSSDATSAQTVGLVFSTSIAANQKGFIMLQGLLDGLSTLPTSTWNDGDAVYLGPTAGSITPTKPYAPSHLVYLGVVTTASPGSAGRMYVKVQNGYELDELHNVQAQTPTVNDVLYYFGGTPGQWKTASLATILGYTPLSQTLANTQIFVGNASNVATAVAMSGDTTISNTGAVTIANNAVTYAKMQAVSATSILLGSSSTTTPVQEIILGTNLSMSGNTLNATGGGGNSIGELTGDVTAGPATTSSESVASTLKTNLKTGSFGVTVDGVTAVIQAGTVGYVVMPYTGTITGWSITANVIGSIQFDVWRATGAIPTISNPVISNALYKPKLVSDNFETSNDTTSWTTGFAAGDVFGFYVDSASTIKNATLTIRTTKS